jgi:hypothetical protein
MPNCFQLTKKGESEPTSLVKVDEEICAHLGREVHPKWWCCGWYDIIGFSLAMGDDFAKIRGWLEANNFSEDMIKILDYLEANYTASSWYETKR